MGVMAVVLLLSLRVMPPDPPTSLSPHTRLDVIGLALIGPGCASLLLVMTQTAEQADVTAWPIVTPSVIGVVLLAGYVVHASRPRPTPPVIDLRLFTRGGFTASVTVMALTGVAMYSSLLVLPLFLQQTHSHSPLTTGLLIAPLGVGRPLRRRWRAGSVTGQVPGTWSWPAASEP